MKTLSVFITPYCNLNCDICYSNAEHISKSTKIQENNLNLEQWREVLIEAKFNKFDHLHIFGGEPFLADFLREFCILANSLGFQILIATNGISFQDSDFEWIQKKNIQISFTVNEINHDWNNMNPLKKHNLEQLREYGIDFSIATCLTKGNYQLYSKFVTDMRNHGIGNFFGIYFSPIGRGSEKLDSIIEMEKWIKFVEMMNTQFGIRIEQSVIKQQDLLLYPWISSLCPISKGDMTTITYSGEIFPCFLLMRSDFMIFKWIKQGDFSIAISFINQLQKKNFSACPAYYDNNGVDFREKQLNTEEKGKICLICPLISL